MFDLAMIKSVYERMNERINAARIILGRPLTLTEKILYSHLWSNEKKVFKRLWSKLNSYKISKKLLKNPIKNFVKIYKKKNGKKPF